MLAEYSSSLHAQMLLKDRRFNEIQVMEAALDIARGMNFLHSKGVAHRSVVCCHRKASMSSLSLGFSDV